MAQLNRYSFAGYYFNQPNVKVRQVTKGSPPLRGSNFIAPGRTGEIWTPKKHGGRMLTLEILVIDEPRGTARMIFDRIQQLAATRTQGALVNYLDSGPRTAQAEIVNWMPQDIDNVGLVFVGQLDFYLADPWFYRATVTSAATAITNTPTIGTVAGGLHFTSGILITMANVISGQPIVIMHDGGVGPGDISSITDTFAGHYTWTKIVAQASSRYQSIWIGTGGTGTSGVITVIGAPADNGEVTWALSLAGASVGVGAAAVDTSGAAGRLTTQPATLSLTPSASLEIAIASIDAPFATSPAIGWSAVQTTSYPAGWQQISAYLYPTSGVALPATWALPTGSAWDIVGIVVKAAAGSAIATLSVTNSGTATAEDITLDILGPVTNPQVVNATTGTSVAFTGAVASGKHLLIDTGAFTALNDGANVTGSVTHAGAVPFLTLAPGVNALSIYGSVAAGSPTLTVSFVAPYE
jgi:hypothetical protein